MLSPQPGRELGTQDRQAVHAAFAAQPALHVWPAQAIDALCHAGWLRHWAHGQTVIAQDAACDDIHVVIAGAVEIGWSNVRGARAAMLYVRPGEVINIIAALGEGGAAYDVRAHGSTTLFHIPRDALLGQIAREPALLRGLFDLICQRSRRLYEYIGKSMLRGLRARLAGHIVFLAEWHGQPGPQGVEVGLRLSQDDIASLLGTSRQSVNKELRHLVRQGLVRVRYSRLTALDMAGLRALAANGE